MATPIRPSPTRGQGRSRRSASTSAAIECVLAFVRDHEHGCEVDEEPCAAEQRQDDEPEPEDCGVDVEVAAETA